MNNSIYLLKSDMKNHAIFIEDCNEYDDSIKNSVVDNLWSPFKNYFPIKLKLDESDTGKKNYQLDISGFLSPFYIVSEIALEKLSDIFSPRGQILPVIIDSKKKKFWGYYPTNPLVNCFDKEKSIYREYPNGLLIEKPVLIAQNITDDYLFSIEEDISRVFVTDKFKRRVEEAGLLGFDFSVEIATS